MRDQKTSFVPEAPEDIAPIIQEELTWYLSLKTTIDPLLYESLVNCRRRLAACRVFLARHVSDARYLKDSSELTRKRRMAKVAYEMKDQLGGITASERFARRENEDYDIEAADAAATYDEVNSLFGSLKDVLIALTGDISRLESEKKYGDFLDVIDKKERNG